jgi:nucleoside-diphosphate-sugar epimerase
LHLVNQVRAGEVSGRSEHHLNLAHRDDIAAAVWACFGASPEIKNEILNVADDGAARKADVVAWLAARLGKPVPRFTGVAAEGRAAVTPDRIVSSRKLKTLLDWRPRFPSFRAGYENMLSEAGK